ncbi:hypothetical protein BSSX_p20024 (plasmid) [Bacillus subtilis]|nr:hypothetical protein BSSX_p20003 [Bacillus subtilis]ASK26330.1 hypothetical protein BSSX_p20014 [Bacillus subtilis]ASK26340.1 hypothetical protein BSSX_p20024 [Bacillus subtilis]
MGGAERVNSLILPTVRLPLTHTQIASLTKKTLTAKNGKGSRKNYEYYKLLQVHSSGQDRQRTFC